MRGLVFGVGLAVIVAAPALGQGLPPVPTPSLPALPTVVPSLPAPPALPAPTLPSVPALPRLPSVPSVPGVGSPGGSSQRVTPTGGGGGAVSGGGRSGAAASAPRAGGGSRAVGSGQGSSSSATRRTAQRSARPRARAVARRDRRLRSRVRRFEACIGALPRSQRRVLRLRAGVGGERPQTRRRVARTLQVSTRRVRRLEHRGIRRLRGLARAGHCSADEHGIVGGGDDGGGTIQALGGLAATGLGGLIAARALRGLSGTAPDRVEVKSERESSGDTTRKPGPADAGAEPLKPRPPGAILERDGRDLTLPLLLLAMAAALVIAVFAVRRNDPRA